MTLVSDQLCSSSSLEQLTMVKCSYAFTLDPLDQEIYSTLLGDILDIVGEPVARRLAFVERQRASQVLARQRNRKIAAEQLRGAAEDAVLKRRMLKNMLPGPKPEAVPIPTPLTWEEEMVRDYDRYPTTATSCISKSCWAQMELQYQAHVGSPAFGRSAVGVRQLQKVVLRKDRNARAFAQRCLKRQLKAQAAAAAAALAEEEAQSFLAAHANRVHASALPPSWEVVAESAPLQRGIKAATSVKAPKKGPKPLYRGQPELAPEGAYLEPLTAPSMKDVSEHLCSFSDASSTEEELQSEEFKCLTCQGPAYMRCFFGNEWVDTYPACPLVWGLIHFEDEAAASLYLFELMQAKTAMGVHGFELSSQFADLSVTETIRALYEVFSKLCIEHAKSFAEMQNKKRAMRRRVISKVTKGVAHKVPIHCRPHSEHEFGEQRAFGCGPREWVSDLGNYFSLTMHSLYDRVRTDIVNCLSTFFTRLGSLTSLFWDAVSFMEAKVKSFLEEHWFASLIGFSLVSAFVLFLAICIVVSLFCNLCTWLGFSGAAVTVLLSLASGVFMAYLGLKHCIDADWDQLILSLIFSFSLPKSKEDGGAVGNSFGLTAEVVLAPFVWLIKKIFPAEIAKRNGIFSAASHFSSSVAGATKLKDQFTKFGSAVLDYTSNVFDALCGKSAASIRMLSAMVDIDFSTWCLEVEKYGTETYEALVINKCARQKKLRLLDDQRLAFEPMFLDPVNKMPHIACQMYWKASEILAAARFKIGRCKFFDKPRVTPFSLWFYGESGCGKSAGVPNVMNDLLDRLGFPKVDRYFTRKISTEYWDNYEHQTVCVFDDIGALPRAEEDFFDVITNVPVPVHMSAVADKGRIFTSEFIVSTSNLLSKRPDSKVADQQAFDNRRHFLIECKKNPDYNPNVHSSYDHTLYTLRSPNTPGYGYRTSTGFACEEPQWFGHSVLIDILYDGYALHHEKCKKAMGNCGLDELNLGCKDFFYLCKRVIGSLAHKHSEYTEEDFVKLLDSFDKYDPTVGLKLRPECNVDIDENLKLKSLMNIVHSEFTDDDVYDCISILPLSKRGRIFSAIVEHESYIFETEHSFTNFERYLFHRLQKLRPLADMQQNSFKQFYENFKSKLVSVYNAALKKAPAFIKFALAIGFFFLFGYGFYVAACKLTSCATSLGGLGAVVATGCGLSMSQDNKTKEKEKKVDHSYKKSTWTPSSGRYWADDEEAFGNSAEEEFELSDAVLQQAESNFDFVKPYVVALTDITDPKKPCTAVGYSLGGTCVLFVGHTWTHQIRSGMYHYRCGTDQIKFYLPKTRLQVRFIPNFDLVAVQLPAMVPKARGKGFDMIPRNRSLVPEKGPFYCYTPSCALSGSGSQISVATVYNYRPISEVTRELHFITYDVNGSAYPVSAGCGYRSYLGRGDCGTVAFSPTEAGKPPAVCLMHDSAKPGQPDRLGHGSFLTQEDLAAAQDLRNMIAAEGNCGYFEKSGGIREANVVCLGNVAPHHKPRYSRNTQIEPSLISKCVDIPNTQAPAIISNSDPRIVASANPTFDVFECGMIKYKEAALPMIGTEEDQQEDFQDALDDIFECLAIPVASLSEVSEEVALQGIDGVEYFDPIVPSTSEGWPWVLQRPVGCKGKSWLLEGIAGCFTIDRNSPFGKAKDQWELDLQQGRVPELVGTECPKDETVPVRKVTTKPKTRLFTVLPFEYNLLVREYYLEFVAEYMKRHDDCPGKVGINVHGLSWTNLYHKLKAKGNNWANGDFERFDGITPRDVLTGLVVRMNKLFKSGGRPMANQVRSALLLAASDRYSIAGEKFYRVTGGIPSGFPLTVIVNSLVNEFFLRFAFKRLVRAALGDRIFCTREVFENEVELAVYGDDNLFSVTDRYKDIYNLCTISAFLRNFNVVLKNGQDKDQVDFPPFSPPTSCDFLKRRMVLSEEGQVLCPLNEESIHGMAHWVRKSSSLGDATHQNCQTILREAFYKGRDYFHDIRRKLTNACQKVGLDSKSLITYDAAKRAWLGNISPFYKDYSPVDGMPRVLLEANDMFQKVLPDVYLMGIMASRALIPSGAQVVWCGATDPYKPYITHRLVTPARSGYINGLVAKRVIKTLDVTKPIVFMSCDGLSHAVPPLIFYVRRLHGLGSEQERDILSRASKVNGSLPKLWSETLAGDGCVAFDYNEAIKVDFEELSSDYSFFKINRCFPIKAEGKPEKFCRMFLERDNLKPTFVGHTTYINPKTGVCGNVFEEGFIKESTIGVFCGGSCPRHFSTKRTGDDTISTLRRAIRSVAQNLCA
ncbi:TPA_asm: polyprotein [Orobanche cernua secovirus]|uniref:Polyprotein n=1 Tax=Orobanche cernua secovirus TaxID=2936689 RepID=A0A9N6YJA4_9SECO|nr:TPA_asm: polyprotein [Orobanche cernua secovirus]